MLWTVKNLISEGIRDLSLIPLTAVCRACIINSYLILIVHTRAFFFFRFLFSACGEFLKHRAYSILPGWNREGMAARRHHSVSCWPDTAVPFPAACPMEGRQYGTICRSANRKYSGHRRILPHYPVRYSSRCHSCSIHAPAFLPYGIVSRS